MAKNPIVSSSNRKRMARVERERIQTRYLLIATISIGVIVVGLILYGIFDQLVLVNMKPVARVDKQVINIEQYQQRVRYERWNSVRAYNQYAQLAQMFGNDQTYGSYFQSFLSDISTRLNDPAAFGSSVVDTMVDEILIAREAKSRGMEVSDQEVEEAIQNAFGYFANGTPTPTVTPTEVVLPTLNATQQTFVQPTATLEVPPTEIPLPSPTLDPAQPTATVTPTQAPTASPTPYTLEGYQTDFKGLIAEMEVSKIGEEDLRKAFYHQLLRTKVFEAVTADVKGEQEQVWARHILVADEDTARQVLERLKAGEDFSALVEQYSLDNASKPSGDLGWFGRGKMVAPFEDAAFALAEGQISEPVQSDFGWHVIQVLGHANRPIDAGELQSMKQTAFDDWLESARQGADIQKFEDVIANQAPTEPAIQPYIPQ